MAQRALTVLSGLAKGKVFPLSAERITVGRDDNGTIVFDDNDISREHAVLILEGQDYQLKDLQSRNGTRVNGQLIKEKLLVPGDRIQFGLVETRYEATQPAVPKPAPAAQTVVTPVRIPPPPAAKPVTPVPPAPVPKPIVAPALPVEDPRLRAELEEAKRKLAQADEVARQNQQLAGQMVTLRQQLDAVKQQASRVEELSRQNNDLVGKLKAAQEQATALRQELPAAKQQVVQADEIVRQKQELVTQNQQLAGQVTTLRQQLDKTQQEAGRVEELSRQNNDLANKLKAAQEQVTRSDGLAGQITTLRQQLQQSQRQATEQAAKVAQLATLQVELQQLRQQAGRVEELTRQNSEVTGQFTKVQEQLAAVQQELTTVKQQAQGEMVTLRAELVSNRQQAGRVAELTRLNEELSARASGQQQAAEQAAAQVQESITARTALQARLEDLERKNRELTGLVTGAQAREKDIVDRAQAEQNRVTKRVNDMQAELEDARQRRAQSDQLEQQNKMLATQVAASRMELARVRQQQAERPVSEPPRPPAVEQPAALVPSNAKAISGERVAEYERVQSALRDAHTQLEKLAPVDGKQNLAERLDALRTRLAETEGLEDKAAMAPLRRLREDVAEVRAALLGLSDSAALAAGTPAMVVKSSGRHRGLPVKLFAIAGAVAVVVIAVALTARQGTRAKPVVETKMAVPKNDSAPAPVAPAAEEPPAVVCTDSEGRFTCRVPRGWTTQKINDEARSRVKFVSGNDEIRVNSYGADWPDLQMTAADQKEAESAIGSLLKLDNQEEGSYAEVVSRGWRRLEGTWAYQSEMKLAAQSDKKLVAHAASWRVQVVYYRKLGREHIIALYIRSLDQEQYLRVVMSQFLEGFQSVAAKKQAAQLAASP